MASYHDKPLTKSILSNLFLRNSCQGDVNVPGLNVLTDKTYEAEEPVVMLHRHRFYVEVLISKETATRF